VSAPAKLQRCCIAEGFQRLQLVSMVPCLMSHSGLLAAAAAAVAAAAAAAAAARLRDIVSDLQSRVSSGEVPYVHCWGGRGRVGLVGACFLAATYG
jgi:hypothetical protein